MRRCPACAEEVLERAAACHICHTLLPEAKSPSEGAAHRRPGRVARLGLIAISAAMLGAVTVPALRRARADECQPRNWVDWHLAMRRQCLSQEYVCRNMTTAQMLADPDVAAEYLGELAGGRDASLDLSEMVGRMRQSYGCGPEAGVAAGPPSWLPKGHPPIGDHLPPGHPRIGGRLAPGHPPAGDHLPPGHPPIRDLAPNFEPPSTFDI